MTFNQTCEQIRLIKLLVFRVEKKNLPKLGAHDISVYYGSWYFRWTIRKRIHRDRKCFWSHNYLKSPFPLKYCFKCKKMSLNKKKLQSWKLVFVNLHWKNRSRYWKLSLQIKQTAYSLCIKLIIHYPFNMFLFLLIKIGGHCLKMYSSCI